MTQVASPRIIPPPPPPPPPARHQSSSSPSCAASSHPLRGQFDGITFRDSVLSPHAAANAQPHHRYPHSRSHLNAKAKASATASNNNPRSIFSTISPPYSSSSSTAHISASASAATSPLAVPTADAAATGAPTATAPAASALPPQQAGETKSITLTTTQTSLPSSVTVMQSQPRASSPYASFSPSSLPTQSNLNQTGFPPSTSSPAPFTNIYASSPEPSRAELSVPSSYPPAALPFDSGSHIHRTNTLSPTSALTAQYQQQQLVQQGQLSPSLQSPPNQGSSLLGISLSRSVSADAAVPPQPSSRLAERLAQQNKHIRDAWEAERNYLEANRRRAEEVYQEERVIMEEERDGWEREKAAMQQEIQVLRERVQRLEGENSALKAVAAQSIPLSGLVSPMLSQQGGSVDNYFEGVAVPTGPAPTSVPGHIRLPNDRLSPPAAAADASQLPPGLENAARRPHFASPTGSASRQSPMAQPESSPFIPLDPSVKPQGPQNAVPDFLGSPGETAEAPIPIIDVQEIDPKLEGIPIKATAVQKLSFGEVTPSKASPATSPPTDQSNQVKRASSRDQTLQVLRAEESERRTMHAGHTPNHSLSLFPTVNATAGTTASGPSEGTTPTAAYSSAPTEHHGDSKDENEGSGGNPTEAKNKDKVLDGSQSPPLEPTEDSPLKGPLMIKNIPAQDEIFWSLVNKKLEPISEGRDALPTVMRADEAPEQVVAGPSSHPVTGGGDALHEPGAAPTDDALEGQKTIEDPVRLKLKTTTNFGAPFGTM